MIEIVINETVEQVNIEAAELIEQVFVTVSDPDLSMLASKWVIDGQELMPADTTKRVNAQYLTGILSGGLFHP